jgi:hypothetical protein
MTVIPYGIVVSGKGLREISYKNDKIEQLDIDILYTL